jgi:hypothetical protein
MRKWPRLRGAVIMMGYMRKGLTGRENGINSFAARSPQPAARSPQPAARSPQPAARSPCFFGASLAGMC